MRINLNNLHFQNRIRKTNLKTFALENLIINGYKIPLQMLPVQMQIKAIKTQFKNAMVAIFFPINRSKNNQIIQNN